MSHTAPFKKVLVATDGSEESNRALDFASSIATGARSELRIVTVLPALWGANGYGLGKDRAKARALERKTEAILNAAMARARKSRVETIVTDALYGDEATAIVAEAAKNKTDLIVVGRRGRGRVKRLLLGSVSGKIAAISPIRVLVVP